jgi:hypothetical protein
MWFNGNPTNGVCPAGGAHTSAGSGNYTFNRVSAPCQQTNWRWCQKCQGMWFNGNPTNGVCPAGGAHTRTGSGDYPI